MRQIFSPILAKTFALLFFLALWLASAQPALAVSQQEAEQIRQTIQNSIDMRSHLLGQDHLNKIEWDGTLSVTPSGDFYSVRLPHLRLRYPDKSWFDFGVIAMNVVPDDNGFLRGSISLPTPMTFHDAGGATAFEISIGAQKLSGIWDPQTDVFKAVNSQYKDIKLGSSDGKFSMLLGELKAVANLQDNPDGTLSGPTEVLIRNVDIRLAEPGVSMTIEKLLSKNKVEKLDLQKMHEFQKKIAEKTQRLQSGTATKEETESLSSDISSDFFDYIAHVSDGFTNDIAVSGFSFNRQDAQEPLQFNVSSISSQIGMTGLQGPQANGYLTFNMIGLESISFPVAYADIIPREMNVSVSVGQLPFQKLMAALQQTTQQAMKMQDAPTEQQQVADSMVATFPMILGEAGAFLDIKNTYMKSPLTEVRLEGNAVANASAVRGGTATFITVFTGLHELKAKLQTLQQQPENASNAQLGQALMSLTMMQLMGQAGTDATGKPTTTFKYEVTADGQTLLNGKPMGGAHGTDPAMPQQTPQTGGIPQSPTP